MMRASHESSVPTNAAMNPFAAHLARLSTGTQFGNYVIEEPLGAGASGIVYRARQVSLRRVVALKVFTDSGLMQSRNRLRFLQEGRLAARVRSSRIVQLFEAVAASLRASWPGFAPPEVQRLLVSARERLDTTRLMIDRPQTRLGELSHPEPGPVR